jgi:hypothetical protein
LYVNQIKLAVGTLVFVLLMFVPYNSDEEEEGSSNAEVILTWMLPQADEEYESYDNYYEYLHEKYRMKRDLLGNALQKAGFAIPDYNATPGGGFFIFARITPELKWVLPKERLEKPYTENSVASGGGAVGLGVVPVDGGGTGVLCILSIPFFSRERVFEEASDEFIHVVFCKTDETVERAALVWRGLGVDNGDDDDDDEVTDTGEEVVAACGDAAVVNGSRR